MNLLPRLSILSSNFNWYFMMIVMSPWSSDHNADLFACLFQLVFDESTPCMSTPGLSFNWYLINLLVCLLFSSSKNKKSTPCIISGSNGIWRSINDGLNIKGGVCLSVLPRKKNTWSSTMVLRWRRRQKVRKQVEPKLDFFSKSPPTPWQICAGRIPSSENMGVN